MTREDFLQFPQLSEDAGEPVSIYTGCLTPGCYETAVEFYCVACSIALIEAGIASRRAKGQSTWAEDARIAELLRMKEAA